jgi:hypothetical protein
MVITLAGGWALASSMAARRVHWPFGSEQIPSPGWASWVSAMLFTVKVRLVGALAAPAGADGAVAARPVRSATSRIRRRGPP